MLTVIDSPPIQNAGSPINPTALQQNGCNNFANVNSNIEALNYPNCSGSCAFGILRTSPSNFYGVIDNQPEAVIGLLFYLGGSSELSSAETNRIMIEIQKNKSKHEVVGDQNNKLSDAMTLTYISTNLKHDTIKLTT